MKDNAMTIRTEEGRDRLVRVDRSEAFLRGKE
jgi:hypothetical protein